MIEEWKSYLLERADEWGVPASGEWSALFYNNYHPHVMNIDLLWFHDGEAFPRVVTKLCRQPEVPKREFENLTQVYATAGDRVPRPLHWGPHGSFWGLWMTGVPGFRAQIEQGVSPADLRSMTSLVTEMHAAAMRPANSTEPGRYQRMVTDPLQTVAQFGTSKLVSEGARRIEARISEAWFNALPVIPQHGDLYSGNLIRNNGKWYVVDWESYGMIDLPFYDLFTLLFSVISGNAGNSKQWSETLTSHISGCCRLYCNGLGLDSAALALLLPLALVNWFHLQWGEGRQEFATRMHKTVADYFEHTDLWEKVFLC